MPGRVADAIADAAECRIGTFDVFDVDRAERRLGFFVTVLDGMSGGEMPINVLWPRMPALPAKIRVIVDELARNAHRFAGDAPGKRTARP